jgi:hypothetical protein
MIQKPQGYEDAAVFTDRERLPVGGYLLELISAEVKAYGWGSVLVIRFDIAEGPYRGYFAGNYRAQTGEEKRWKGTKRFYLPAGDGSEQDNRDMSILKTAMEAVEASNPGYKWDWDESSLAGKTVGAVFNNKEYEIGGRRGFYTSCHSFRPAEAIQSGNYRIPRDSLLPRKGNAPGGCNPGDYEELVTDEALPF